MKELELGEIRAGGNVKVIVLVMSFFQSSTFPVLSRNNLDYSSTLESRPLEPPKKKYIYIYLAKSSMRHTIERSTRVIKAHLYKKN